MLAQFHFGFEQVVVVLGLAVMLAFCGAACAVFASSIIYYHRRGCLWRATADIVMFGVMLAVASLALFGTIKNIVA